MIVSPRNASGNSATKIMFWIGILLILFLFRSAPRRGVPLWPRRGRALSLFLCHSLINLHSFRSRPRNFLFSALLCLIVKRLHYREFGGASSSCTTYASTSSRPRVINSSLQFISGDLMLDDAPPCWLVNTAVAVVAFIRCRDFFGHSPKLRVGGIRGVVCCDGNQMQIS